MDRLLIVIALVASHRKLPGGHQHHRRPILSGERDRGTAGALPQGLCRTRDPALGGGTGAGTGSGLTGSASVARASPLVSQTTALG